MMRDKHIFLGLLAINLLSLFIVQSWFVPDEFWQSTEIAHHLIYGNGWKSWEWEKQIRSIFYPGIFAILFLSLKKLRLDYVFMLIQLPRVLSVISFTLGQYSVYKLAILLYGKSSANWTALCIATSWFLEYCSPRTLSSSAEMTLLAIAIFRYPWFLEKVSLPRSYLWWGGLSCVIRPTAVVVLLPFCIRHFIISQRKFKVILHFFLTGLIILSLNTLLDSLYYEQITIVPYNFVKFNILNRVSDHYGQHPWHWYLTQGIPAICGIHLIPIILALFSAPKKHFKLFIPIAFTILVYSILPHKEFRFFLPILPFLMCFAGDWISQNLSSKPKLASLILILPNIVFLCYMGLVHQRGPLDAISLLREYAETDPTGSQFLFLMPCHSTPLYSHLHVNVTTRFLTCEPNFSLTDNYQDEADNFFNNPLEWLNSEVFLQSQVAPDYTHIVMFDALSKRIYDFLRSHDYMLCESIFNSHFIDGQKSRNIHIYCKM